MTRTILLIEDDDIQREIVSDLLMEKGYRVIATDTGQKAVDLYVICQPVDLVVLDMNMPDMGGLATLELFKRAGLKPRVVLWTAYLTPEGGAEVLEKARPLGVEAYIEKGLMAENLISYLAEN